MCNRARNKAEPEAETWTGDGYLTERPRDNWFDPVELMPKSRAYVVREENGRRGIDIMTWDVFGGGAKRPITNVRNLALPQWRKLAEDPANRCLVPLTEFAEWTPDKHDLADGKPPLKGEIWFGVDDQPTFAVAAFWQQTANGRAFAMVTCDPNSLVARMHPEAMITILAAEDRDRWLTCSYDKVVALQQPCPASRMRVRGPVFPTRTGETMSAL